MVLQFRRGKGQDTTFEMATDRMHAISADMDALRNGVSPELLSDGEAPILDEWILGLAPSPCLVGLSTGHPILVGENRAIQTSDLWLLSDDRSWARTWSRWYRLGHPGDRAGFHA